MKSHIRAPQFYDLINWQRSDIALSDITRSARSDQPSDTSQAEGGCVHNDLVMNANGIAVINDSHHVYIDRPMSRVLMFRFNYLVINALRVRIDVAVVTYSRARGRGPKVLLILDDIFARS